MSDTETKVKTSKRRYQDETAVKKQAKIAKAHGFTSTDKVMQEPHRLAKRHAMDCGNPECFLCGNPRKTHKDKLTMQEKRFLQDVDNSSNRHGRGYYPEVEDND